jgi:4-hydroxy-2-oxoheptanedioate aldolase
VLPIHEQEGPLKVRYGGWIELADPIIWESVGRAGYDFIVVDVQHGSLGFGEAIRAIQLLDALGQKVFVRISSVQMHEAPRYLDFGLTGVIFATVDDADTARRAIEFTRYQPAGIRSYGGARYGLSHEPKDVGKVRPAVWMMIETAMGVKNIEAIAAVPGVTGLLVGPADLSRAFGLPPSHRGEHPQWNEAVERVAKVCRSRRIAGAMNVHDGEDAHRWVAAGYDHIVIASDIAHLRGALARELAIARNRKERALTVNL